MSSDQLAKYVSSPGIWGIFQLLHTGSRRRRYEIVWIWSDKLATTAVLPVMSLSLSVVLIELHRFS